MNTQFCFELKRIIFCIFMLCLTEQSFAQQKNRPTCPHRPIVLGVYEFGEFYHAGFAVRLSNLFGTGAIPD